MKTNSFSFNSNASILPKKKKNQTYNKKKRFYIQNWIRLKLQIRPKTKMNQEMHSKMKIEPKRRIQFQFQTLAPNLYYSLLSKLLKH